MRQFGNLESNYACMYYSFSILWAHQRLSCRPFTFYSAPPHSVLKMYLYRSNFKSGDELNCLNCLPFCWCRNRCSADTTAASSQQCFCCRAVNQSDTNQHNLSAFFKPPCHCHKKCGQFAMLAPAAPSQWLKKHNYTKLISCLPLNIYMEAPMAELFLNEAKGERRNAKTVLSD